MARKSKVEVQAGQGAVVTNRKVKKLSQQRVRRVSRGAIQHIRVDSDVLTSTMVSTDFGNGYGEAWRLNEEGVIESYAMPHGRIPVTGDMLDANVMANQHDVEWFEWLGADAFVNGEQADDPQRYGYGEGVWDITERAPDQHRNDADRYAGDQQMSQIVLGAAKLGIPSGSELTVMVPIPPSLLTSDQHIAARVRATMKAGQDGKGNGWWSIRLKGERDWRDYYITRIGVLPEGLGAAYAYRFNASGEPIPLHAFHNRIDDMAGLFRIHDVGFGTYDVIDFFNGTLSPDSIRVATDNRGGIQEHMARPIAAEVKRITGVRPTEMQVDAWLRQWVANGFTQESAVQYFAGHELRMFNLFVRLSRSFAAWMEQEKIGPGWDGGTSAIAMAGGGWTFTENAILEKYPQRKILRPALYEHLNWCPIYSLNSYGGLVYLATLLRKDKKG